MYAMTATITVTATETRVLVVDETGDRMVARLPAMATAHRWALRTLLESLALWADRPLRVVLFADESFEWERHGLLDALGFGNDGLHLDVQVVPMTPRRARRGKYLRDLGSFALERRRLRNAGVQR